MEALVPGISCEQRLMKMLFFSSPLILNKCRKSPKNFEKKMQ